MIGLHSEYRSTYRWHEFGNAATGVVRQAPHPAPPSQPLSRGPMEPAMPRRKKYPGLAYKTNELFDPSATMVNNYKTTSAATLDRARSVERSEAGGRGGTGRRSKSEGPRPPRWTDTVEPKAIPPSLGEAPATKEPASKVMNSTEYRNQFAWPKDGVDSQGGQPRKSISMGTLKLTASQSAAKRKSGPAEGTTEMEPLMNNIDDHANDDPNSKRYIEDYLWNGQKPGVHRGLKGKADSVEGGPTADGPGPDEGLLDGPRSLGNSDSWYREVLDLRKRAGEYKYRGWGTELAPEHITELYNKQIELWYQVSRRSSLSALSLASANHKALPKDETDKDIDGKTKSPKKPKSFRSAPHQSIHAKLQETKRELEKSPQKTSPQKVQRKKMQGHSFDETSATVEGGGSPRRRPRSADPRPVTRSVDIGDGRAVPRKPQDDLDGPSQRSASVAKDHIFDDSPVVKSPPEPTRVKSPEQMNMRSPDPVNWTVPLDTGKTFTVTQNVKNEECMRRAGSEQRGCSSEAADLTPVHQHHLSPNRKPKMAVTPILTNGMENGLAKTPTSPPTLTPIDETKTLDIPQQSAVVNGNETSDCSPSQPSVTVVLETANNPTVFKPTEATQKSHGAVDTTIVQDLQAPTSIAAEVLDRARTRFDKFWGGKKDAAENENV